MHNIVLINCVFDYIFSKVCYGISIEILGVNNRGVIKGVIC